MRSWLDAAGVYGDRRVASLFFFGFSSGLPLALTGATLAAWFTETGASLTEIGLVSLVGLAYALKFLWSPLVDRLPVPLLTRRRCAAGPFSGPRWSPSRRRRRTSPSTPIARKSSRTTSWAPGPRP